MQLLYTKRKCRNHGFLLAFFGDFLSLLKESYPSETKEERAAGGTFLTQTCYWQKGTRRRQSKKKLLGKYAAGDKRRKDCGERIPSGSEAQNSAKKD